MINCMFSVFRICLSTVGQPWDLGLSNFSSAVPHHKTGPPTRSWGYDTNDVNVSIFLQMTPDDCLRTPQKLACWGQMYVFFSTMILLMGFNGIECYLWMIPSVLLWNYQPTLTHPDNPSKIKLCVQPRCIDQWFSRSQRPKCLKRWPVPGKK